MKYSELLTMLLYTIIDVIAIPDGVSDQIHKQLRRQALICKSELIAILKE